MFYVNSFPRSGNTWIRLMLLQILDASPPPAVNPMFDRKNPGNNDPNALYPRLPKTILEEPEHNHIVKSHGKWHSCHPKVPIVYLVRDGRDAIFSYYHFNVDHEGYVESWASYFDRYVIKRKPASPREQFLDAWMGNWAENVQSYLHKDNVLVVRYEDLRSNTFSEIRRILDFLGIEDITDDRLNLHIKHHERELAVKRQRHGRPRGVVGGWRETYTAEQATLFGERFGDTLSALGYPLT